MKKILICVGHANYGGGVISSADGTRYGGVNEYKYNKELAPHVVEWLRKAGHEADLCIAPEGTLHSLDEEINYFIGFEHAKEYDLAIQLHLNAYNGQAHGCEAYAYNDAGLKVADAICKKLGTVWDNRGPQIRTGLYWTRKTKACAVLVESFFCDNAQDYEIARNIGMDAHAKLIAEGILAADIAGNAGDPEEPVATILRKGDYSERVRQYQEDLLFVGISVGKYGVDGDFGSDTEKATIEFQNRCDLTQDGIAGPITLAKLAEVITQMRSQVQVAFTVQAGAFKSRENAERRVVELKAAGFDAFARTENGLHYIQAGAFDQMENAEELVRQLLAAGFEAFVKVA